MSRERRRKRDERRETQAMVAWFREQDLHPEGLVVDGEPTLLVTYGERWQDRRELDQFLSRTVEVPYWRKVFPGELPPGAEPFTRARVCPGSPIRFITYQPLDGPPDRRLPRLCQRSHRPARLRRTRCGSEHAMADDRGRKS